MILARALERLPSAALAAMNVAADAAILAGGFPLERFAFQTAADPGSSAALIVALLGANAALLAIVTIAAASSYVLFCRGVGRVLRYNPLRIRR
jgi:hypothetical protein